MDGNDFRFMVRRSLRVPIISEPMNCNDCQGSPEINVFGDHCLSCKPGGGVVHRHNDAYRVILQTAKEAHLTCSAEVPIQITDSQTSLSPSVYLTIFLHNIIKSYILQSAFAGILGLYKIFGLPTILGFVKRGLGSARRSGIKRGLGCARRPRIMCALALR